MVDRKAWVLPRATPSTPRPVTHKSINDASCWPRPAAWCRPRRSFPELPAGELEEHVLQSSGDHLQPPDLHAPGLRPGEEGADGGLRLGDLQPVGRRPLPPP